MLRFSVLGPLEVWQDARPVELGPARRRAVLAALLVDAGNVVSVDTLMDRVWDGAPPETAAATLHAYVSRLRGALHGSRQDGEQPLRTVAPGYRLAVPAEAVDALVFTAAVGDARRLLQAGRLEPAREQLTEGLGLWRGRAYADVRARFAGDEADRLRELRLAALELGVDLDLSLGRHAELLGGLTSLVAEEPLREHLRGGLMLALYRSGRQADALRVFAEGRDLLAGELGIDPGPRLQRLQEQILRQDPALAGMLPARAYPGRAVSAPVPLGYVPEPAAGTDAPLGGARLVGREPELRALAAALTQAQDGQPVAVALVGQAGIGKTRLAEEAALRARDAGAVVAWGRCWEHEGAPPLWPWTQLLRELARVLDGAALRQALDGRTAVLGPLVPELLSGEAVAPVPAGSLELTELRTFDAVCGLLEQLSERRTLVLVIEDLHWGDPASLRLAEYVVDCLHPTRLALILTVRSPSDDPASPGPGLLAALGRNGRTRRLDLRGLDREDVRAYVADRTGSRLDDATATALQERTGGNPFYVGELVRLLVTDEEVTDAGLPEQVPDSVREVVARRVRRLPEGDQAVLRAAAVVGRTFDLDLLEQVTGLPVDAVDEAVDRATASGMLCSELGSPLEHRFSHALVQEAFLADVGPARRRRLHARIAAALETRTGAGAAPGAARLAHHLSASATEPALRRAVELWLLAADAALTRWSYAEARDLLGRAVADATRMQGPDAAGHEATARVRLSSLLTTLESPSSAAATEQRERVVALGQSIGSHRDLLTAQIVRWGEAFAGGDVLRAERIVAEMALAAQESGGDPLLELGLLHSRGEVRLQQGRLGEALADLEAAARLAEQVGPTIPPGVFPVPPTCSARGWWALALALRGDRERAHRVLAEAKDRAEATGEPYTGAYLASVQTYVHVCLDEPDEALATATRVLVDVDEHGFTGMDLFVRVVLGWAVAQADLTVGLAQVEEAFATLDALPSMLFRPMQRGLHAGLLLDSGDAGRAVQVLDAALAEARATGDELYTAELHRLRAQARAQAGAARDEVSGALAAARRTAELQGAELFLRRAVELEPLLSGR